MHSIRPTTKRIIPSKSMATGAAAAALRPPPPISAGHKTPYQPLSQFSFPSKPTSKNPPPSRTPTKLLASSPKTTTTPTKPSSSTADDGVGVSEERIFFDGGAHYGDLLANLALGFTLLWLPLTLAAVFRAFFLRYRFTDRRVTVVSGLTGGDRTDFPYSAIRNVQTVPRFIGEWGDIVVTLKDGTKVDLRSVPRFREIADYCLLMSEEKSKGSEEKRGGGGPRGF